MRKSGTILIEGVVQGVGFRPFVYATAKRLGISGTVANRGSTVEITAFGENFENFLAAIRKGPPLARIDNVTVSEAAGDPPPSFTIGPSLPGVLSGMIPPDIATCNACVTDIFTHGGRYEGYWGTSCVDCGPRYSIIQGLPYDRERTSMSVFPLCGDCHHEYADTASRRHHAQSIACASCGPSLRLLDRDGEEIQAADVISQTASLIDSGNIIAIRGIGGFHLCCTEESASVLKKRLMRTEQAFAVLMRPEEVVRITEPDPDAWRYLTSPERPIVVLNKRDPGSHTSISTLHTLGCMLPYTGFHHLLFHFLRAPLIVMTSANVPGDPMITTLETATARLSGVADFFLTHDREIVNRCDDSVVRDGFLIRLSRGYAPKRTRIALGNSCILGVGPELNANCTLYREGCTTTSPHVGNVRNPQTFEYLKETIQTFTKFLGARYDIIAHDLHPQFLSTRYAREIAEEHGADLVPVQHHRAHIASVTQEPCIGIALDGVGYGDDGTVWGGEVFAGSVPDLTRVAHLDPVPMPGGDLAGQFPERMLFGFLPDDLTTDILLERGWNEVELRVMSRQVSRRVNTTLTSSTGRALDAVAALLGICREKTYDGEPAMRLESVAASGRPETWEVPFRDISGVTVLSTRDLVRQARDRYLADANNPRAVSDIAASFQDTLARGVARMAIEAAGTYGMSKIAISGGVVINHAIRSALVGEIASAGLTCLFNREYPLGDGCISFGQCVTASHFSR